MRFGICKNFQKWDQNFRFFQKWKMEKILKILKWDNFLEFGNQIFQIFPKMENGKNSENIWKLENEKWFLEFQGIGAKIFMSNLRLILVVVGCEN